MHHVAAALEHVAEGVAEGGPAAAAGVQRTGGVGRHELDVDPLAAAEVGPGVAVLPAVDDVAEHARAARCRAGGSSRSPGRRSPPAPRGPAGRALRRSTSSPASSRGVAAVAASPVAMATFDDQSPCSRRAGRSRWISAGGSMPTSARAARRAVARVSRITGSTFGLSLEQGVDPVDQVERLEGLGDVVVGTGFHARPSRRRTGPWPTAG